MVVCPKELSNWSPDTANTENIMEILRKVTALDANVKDFVKAQVSCSDGILHQRRDYTPPPPHEVDLLKVTSPSKELRRGTPKAKNVRSFRYALPMDLRYLFVLRSPILDAFFFTASVGRPSSAATLAVGLLGKSFLSNWASLRDQRPFTAFFLFAAFFFFAILCFLSLNGIQL